MKEHQIRPCSVLTFDEDKEKDIIDVVNNLKDRKKLGIFITNLIRIALESPETYGSRNEMNQVLAKIDELGITPVRYNYFNQLNKEVNDIKKKVDSIYDMAYKTYMLAQMGKHLGLEDKSTNLMLTSFILERQVTDLCNNIGVNNLSHTFASNKIEDTKSKADEILQFIIESYDGILSELKNVVSTQRIVVATNDQIPTIEQNSQKASTDGNQIPQNTNSVNNNENTEENNGNKDDDASKYEGGTIEKPTGDRAALLMKMMKKKPDGGE